MRSVFASIASALLLGLCAFLGAEQQADNVKVRLQLVDAETGKPMPGIVRILPSDGGKPLPLAGLYDRLTGVQRTETVAGWHVVGASGATVTLPRAPLKLEALSGLETALVRQDIDLAAKAPAEIVLKVPYLFRPEKLGWSAGNTHLHLRNLTLAGADDYLKQIPAADGLQVMFISYLERFKDDEHYITNRYPVGDLKSFDGANVLFNNGEEHRHNFDGYGQGYGHVMLLNLKQFIKPASVGPGITGAGSDDTPLAPGIEDSRKQGGTIIWCHNTSGLEATAHVLAGRLDALNVFDGSRTGSFEDRYYLYLNVGLRLPISTGTDWFMYDFSRVYAKMSGPLTIAGWLDALKAGRTVATNGPFLTLTVDGKTVGDVLSLAKSGTVKIEATGTGRKNFQQLQLVHNGKVIKTQSAATRDGGYHARLQHELRIDEPAWLAVRIDAQNRNEFDLGLFAHTSPIYIDLAGKRVFDVEAARTLLKQLDEARAAIRAKGKFSGPAAAEKVLAQYDQATKDLQQQINQRGGK
jgi:hypothetical protein